MIQHDPTILQSWEACCGSQGPHALLVGSGGLEIQKGIAGMDSLDKHVKQSLFGIELNVQTWAAERPAAPLPTHCFKELNLDNGSLVCSSHVSQLSSAATKGWA